MVRELTLPNGETVTPDDTFLYNNYPYRVQFPDGESSADEGSAASAEGDDAASATADRTVSADENDEAREVEFELSPLYWGGGEMDIPFRSREALVEQWGSESRGTLAPEEWEQWLCEVRHDDRFGDGELDALARELPTGDGGLVARIRDALSL